MGGIIGFVKDVFIIYVCIRLMMVWLFGAKFSTSLGMAILALLIVSVFFMMQRVGVIPKVK